MKLSYSIPKKVWWITNFLDYHMYKGIHDAIIKERKKINLHSSKGIWSEHLINNIEPPKRVGVDNYKPFEHLKAIVELFDIAGKFFCNYVSHPGIVILSKASLK